MGEQMLKYSRTEKTLKQVGSALKTSSAKIWQNSQMVIVCRIKVY